MTWLSLKILSKQQEAEQLSDSLEHLGAVAVTFEDAADEPLYEPNLGQVPLWQQTWVVGLFESDVSIDPILLSLTQEYGPQITGRLRLGSVADQEWQLAWREHFKPLCFGSHLWVCPDEQAVPDPAAIKILLAPGLAFGTGTHPTTALCLEGLAAEPPKDKTVLDYGCGSGILAIAALKLGAKTAVCVDHDPQALLATADNALQNQLDPSQISTYLPADLAPETFDLVIANILAGPLVELAPTLLKHLKPGGELILSGLLAKEAPTVMLAYQPEIHWQQPNQQGDWIRLKGRLDKK